ncbi:hypothetical protein STAN_4094 [Streptomyces sp. CBMAI 2042]|uniref:hypothetical protein n=1 Tax=Streptomyces sp. CBMAI 2042 TaxID=2305222 RepID=UPI000F29173A|nr:hypothetical protein [Streptomyces sp. CBMAI 2042]RLV68570.1 hypothetical protein STAN_4094 [Streptomyces sp. CBMAI 2042]
MDDSALLEAFEQHEGSSKDFYLNVGPADIGGEPAPWDSAVFAERLRRDVEAVLSLTFDLIRDAADPTGGYTYWYESDERSVSLQMIDPEQGHPFDKVPAWLIIRSRSEKVATWELSAGLYRDLCSLGTYLLLAETKNCDLVTANFDVGDDW